jgi:mono/diheme cytochrome c family protein
MRAYTKIAFLLGLSLIASSPTIMAAKDLPGDQLAKYPDFNNISAPKFRLTGEKVSATRGESIFVEHCAICHGIHGKGDGPRSAFFNPAIQYFPDLTIADYIKGRDKELLESVRDGLARLPEPAITMPPYRYILSEEELKSVVAYIKTLPGKYARIKR